MKTVKGPAIFLAQFMAQEPPFDTLESACKWLASVIIQVSARALDDFAGGAADAGLNRAVLGLS